MGKYLLWLVPMFHAISCMKILLGNKTLVLISMALSQIGPNLVSEYMNLRVVEFSRVCVLLYVEKKKNVEV